MLERLDLIKLQPVDRVLDRRLRIRPIAGDAGGALSRRADDRRRPGGPVPGGGGRCPRQPRLGRGRRKASTLPPGPRRARSLCRRRCRCGWPPMRMRCASAPTQSTWSGPTSPRTGSTIPLAAVAEWHRVIRPEGLLMFSAFGVDTLKEVRPREAARRATGPTYQDMHDWGDALSAAGFADPVMDVERLTLTYEDAEKFWRDARAFSMMPDRAQPAAGERVGSPCRSNWSMGTRGVLPSNAARTGSTVVNFIAPGASYNRKLRQPDCPWALAGWAGGDARLAPDRGPARLHEWTLKRNCSMSPRQFACCWARWRSSR